MTRRAMKRLISRVKSLKDKLTISWVSLELFPDPLELVKRFFTEILPLHMLLWANLWPGSPATSVGSSKAAFGISKEVPEVFCRAKVADFIVPVDVPHELSKEVFNRHLTEIITTYDLNPIFQDLFRDPDILLVKRKGHRCFITTALSYHIWLVMSRSKELLDQRFL
jgi:hypothetical protein